MKIIKSAQAGNIQQAPVQQAPSPQVPVQQQSIPQVPIQNQNILPNKQPLNRELIKNLLNQYKNNLSNLIGNVDRLDDNIIEIQLAQLNKNMQLLIKSATVGSRQMQIAPQQATQQTTQMLNNVPK
jgi:hypothetical protein